MFPRPPYRWSYPPSNGHPTALVAEIKPRHPGTEPGLFVIGLAPNPDSAPLQNMDVARGIQPVPPYAVAGHRNQDVAFSQSGVQRVPAPPAIGTGGPGDADILIYARKRHAGSHQLLPLGFRVAARRLEDSGAAGADIAVGLSIALPLTGVNCTMLL